MTNFEKRKAAITVDELVVFLLNTVDCCKNCEYKPVCTSEASGFLDCIDGVKKWLMREAE